MLVKDLKLMLEKLDENLEIFVQENHMEKGNCLTSPTIVKNHYISKRETFVDAFDNERYESEVKRISFSETSKECYILN